MPTYEYACSSCHRHTEAVQSFTDPPLTECPHCGGHLKRVFHPVGILLKGSGFYSTDNRSSSKGAAKKDKAETTADGGASGAKPGADKPAGEKKASDAKPAGSSSSEEKKK